MNVEVPFLWRGAETWHSCDKCERELSRDYNERTPNSEDRFAIHTGFKYHLSSYRDPSLPTEDWLFDVVFRFFLQISST